MERWFEALKYQHLYRHEIDDGLARDAHVSDLIDVHNHGRPHQALDFALPIDHYLTTPTTNQEPNRHTPQLVPIP